MRVAAIILAAGASRRLGEPKQLLRHQGRPLIGHAIDHARAAGCDPILVVTGAHADRIERVMAAEGVTIVRHDGWAQGQGSSLAAGVRHVVDASPAPDRILVLLTDQPGVAPEHLRALIDATRSPRMRCRRDPPCRRRGRGSGVLQRRVLRGAPGAARRSRGP